MRRFVRTGAIKALGVGTALFVLGAAVVVSGAADMSGSDKIRLNVAGVRGPTTKMLAIGYWTAKATMAGVRPLMAAEVRDTVQLYLDGVIDQWFVQQDNAGVVFLLNVTDPAKAHLLLEKLPLGQGGLMEFQLTPLGPISPLASLIRAPGHP